MLIFFWMMIAVMTIFAAALVCWPLCKQKAKTGYFMAALLAICAIACYFSWGASKDYQHYLLVQQQQKIVKEELAKIRNPDQVIEQLQAHLKLHPESAEGWYLLARLYLGMQRYNQAEHYFATALHLQPNKNIYVIGYAEAVFFNHQQQLTPKAELLLQHLLAQNSLDVSALNLLALNAYHHQNYTSAVRYWERLIPVFPVGSDDSKMLLNMIAVAQKKQESH
jgi:cytochrome c-type biogenesis protein CcmH